MVYALPSTTAIKKLPPWPISLFNISTSKIEYPDALLYVLDNNLDEKNLLVRTRCNPPYRPGRSMYPTGRFYGRITQKGPSKNVNGRTNLRQNFGQIFPETGEKGPNI
jgi:hypothetical protein